MATPRKATARAPSGERPAKKAPARKAGTGRPQEDGQARSGRRRPPQSMRTVALSAAGELAALIGRDAEGVVGVERTEDGWRVEVEVVESRRIPDTTDILATYEVDVDDAGTVTGYRRSKRFVRGRIQE